MFPYSCEKCSTEVILTFSEYAERNFKRGRYGARIICATCAETTPEKETVVVEEAVTTPPPRPKRQKPALSIPAGDHITLTPKERQDYGVTVTIREQETHQVHVLVGHGAALQALRDVCDRIDAADGNWKIVSISTPPMIFRDLQGMHDRDLPDPETQRLGAIGRKDLLDADRRQRDVV